MEITKREKQKRIISHLQILRTWCAVNPDYGKGLSIDDCHKAVEWLDDTLDLLKAQEPRVMTLEEIRMHEVYWAERENVSRPWPIAMHHIRNAGLLGGLVYQDYMGDDFNAKGYGKTWRCWMSRPTDEQREAVKWE